jgi:hypothetical protein
VIKYPKGFSFRANLQINSGMALILFVVCFFGLLWMARGHPEVAEVYTMALTGLLTAFGGYLVKRNSNNKIELRSQQIRGDADEDAGCDNPVGNDPGSGGIDDPGDGQQKA